MEKVVKVETAGVNQTNQKALEAAAAYIASLTTDKSRRAAKQALRMIAAAHGAIPLDYVGVSQVRAQLAANYKPASTNLALSVLRGIAREAFLRGVISAEEYARVKSVRNVRGETLPAGRALGRGEIYALMHVCAQDKSPAGVRDAAIIALMYACGLRRAEVAGLNTGDYSPAEEAIRVRGKGGKERLVYVHNGAAEALNEWMTLRGDEAGPLFVRINKGGRLIYSRLTEEAVYQILRRRAAEAGVQDISPHDLRRTCISDLLEAGADIAIAQKIAGHSSVTTTARYDRRPEEAKRKAAALLHVPYTKRFQ
jgi:site-specific recombinase XerD